MLWQLVCGVFAREFVNNCRISKISQLNNIHHERRGMNDFSMSFTAIADTIEIVSRGEIFPIFRLSIRFPLISFFLLPHSRIHHIKFHCAVFQSIWRSIYPILSFLPFLLFCLQCSFHFRPVITSNHPLDSSYNWKINQDFPSSVGHLLVRIVLVSHI